MARDEVIPNALVANGGVAFKAATGAGVAINVTNGAYVSTYDKFAAQGLIIAVTNSHSSAHVVTITKGAYNLDATPGAAFRASLGDATVTIPAGETWLLGPLETARFLQADNSIYLGFDAGTTGTVEAFYLPKKV